MKLSGAIKERPRFFVIVVLLLGVLVVNELLVRAGTVQGVAFMLLPIFALLGFAFALRPHATLWLYIAVNSANGSERWSGAGDSINFPFTGRFGSCTVRCLLSCRALISTLG